MKELDWIEGWFRTKGWEPRKFQRSAWESYLREENGLVSVSTGFGKTYAGCLGALAQMALAGKVPGIQILYITPLRALSSDILKSLQIPIDEMKLPFRVESRTGDTSQAERSRQKRSPPHILVTTPESFNILLAQEDYRKALSNCRLVVVDEWHDLMGNKRGVQVQLCLAHLKKIAPSAKVWGLTATIGNMELAGEVLNGSLENFSFITEAVSKDIEIECLKPDEIDSFPWSGHLGMAMMEKVINHIDVSKSCLLFTNVRSQAERWYNEFLLMKPDWEPIMAVHHSAVDPERRREVEDKIKNGELKLVICTSSLDLGVDFPMVERVYQVGSPKSISRFIQRAGRSGHTPTGVPRIFFVPTHALELFEYLATELAIERGMKEDILPLELSYDVLSQHMVTLASDEGLNPEVAFPEIKSTYAFRKLDRYQFDIILQFLVHGGRSLSAYPAYHRLKEKDGKYLVHDKRMIQSHLMNIGTITSDPSIKIKFMKGGNLGTAEESFVSKLRKGDKFIFSGRVLEYVMVKDLTLFVRTAPADSAIIPVWAGSRLPLSSLLCSHLKEIFELIEQGRYNHPLVSYLSPITDVQRALSRLPSRDFLLMEETVTREGRHLFLFPFEGRLVHEALAALLSVRMAKETPVTFSFAASEYGLEILGPEDFQFDTGAIRRFLGLDQLAADIQRSLNMTQLAKKQFRDIAQISGLIQQNRAGERRTMKNLQMSSSLLFDVFQTYEPEQPLYHQSYDEVRFLQFQEDRLMKVLRKLKDMPFEHYKTSRPSPLAFPLVIERIGSRVSSESLQERLKRMKEKWTKAKAS